MAGEGGSGSGRVGGLRGCGSCGRFICTPFGRSGSRFEPLFPSGWSAGSTRPKTKPMLVLASAARIRVYQPSKNGPLREYACGIV